MNVFSKLYYSLVWPVMDYGSCIWGTNRRNCTEAVQNRACRYFMAVGKYTPNIAVQGDMGWVPPQIRIWNSMGRCWARFKDMNEDRLNKKSF